MIIDLINHINLFLPYFDIVILFDQIYIYTTSIYFVQAQFKSYKSNIKFYKKGQYSNIKKISYGVSPSENSNNNKQ